MSLVIIDFNRTLYDPDTERLMEGAEAFLSGLTQKGATLVLVSKKEGSRETKLAELGIADLFTEALFVEQKTEALFREIIMRYGAEHNYVLGDYLYQEIRAGKLAGATTIHFKNGYFADLEPEHSSDVPDHVVTVLGGALQYIE